jgi:hypothetical protein
MESHESFQLILKSKLVSNIIAICSKYLKDSGSTRDAAAYCLSSLLSRPDTEGIILSNFLQSKCSMINDWAISGLNSSVEMTTNYFEIVGSMQSIVQIFKRGDRNRLLAVASEMLQVCRNLAAVEKLPTIVRKLLSKLIQRVGITFLPPRVLKWRYQRGNRSLLDNLKPSLECNRQVANDGSEEQAIDVDDDDDDIGDLYCNEIEEIIGLLLEFLRDRDTVVRWSAAKGIGRISMHLSKSDANDVLSGVIDVFDDYEDDSSWQGGCLAIAELVRRGLLLPHRLGEDVVPIVQRALNYDLFRGQHSVGSHVRDAACYVCWSFARAYSAHVMAPYMNILIPAVLTVTVFDREINCRRAAAAAFQETVGRQGHELSKISNKTVISVMSSGNRFLRNYGIDVIQIADYFSLSNRGHAYLHISSRIGILDRTLLLAFIDHLRYYKLSHWDEEIRLLASSALSNLLLIADCEVQISVLGSLIEDCLSSSLATRHGCLTATAEILYKLSYNPIQLPNDSVTKLSSVSHSLEPYEEDNALVYHAIPHDLIEEILHLIPKISKARLYRGRGGEIFRCATCLLIENIARSNISVSKKLLLIFLETLNENLRQPHEIVQVAASQALREYLFCYFGHSDMKSEAIEKVLALTCDVYIQGLKTEENMAITRGCALGIGSMPVNLLLYDSDADSKPNINFMTNKILGITSNRLGLIFDTLRRVIIPETSKSGASPSGSIILACADIETRRNALNSLVDILEKMELSRSVDLFTNCLRFGIKILNDACDDYSVDSRGDVGSWIRCAAIRGLERLLRVLFRMSKAFIPSPNKNLPCRDVIATSLGPAVIEKTITSNGDRNSVEVCYPESSGGSSHIDKSTVFLSHNRKDELSKEDYVIERHKRVREVIVSSRNTRFGSIPSSDGYLFSTWTSLINGSMISSHSDNELNSCAAENSQCLKNAIFAIFKQLCEKLDAVRSVAGQTLQSMVSSIDPHFKSIPDREVLYDLLFDEQFKPKINDWLQPSLVFPFVINVLKSSTELLPAITPGLIISIGCLTETISKTSCDCFISFCQELIGTSNYQTLTNIISVLVRLFELHPCEDRVIKPLLKTIEIMLRNGIFDNEPNIKLCNGQSISTLIFQCIDKEHKSTNDIPKLKQSIDIFILLLLFDDPTRSMALKTLVILTGHKYPRVRQHAAEQLYMQFLSDQAAIGPSIEEIESKRGLEESNGLTNDKLLSAAKLTCGLARNQADLGKATDILISTKWDGTISHAREARSKLCDYMGLVMKSKKASDDEGITAATKKLKSSAVKDELDSYESLVREAGKLFKLFPYLFRLIISYL